MVRGRLKEGELDYSMTQRGTGPGQSSPGDEVGLLILGSAYR